MCLVHDYLGKKSKEKRKKFPRVGLEPLTSSLPDQCSNHYTNEAFDERRGQLCNIYLALHCFICPYHKNGRKWELELGVV